MSSNEPETQSKHYSEWRRVANLRQGIIQKLDKKVLRLEAELAALKDERESAA